MITEKKIDGWFARKKPPIFNQYEKNGNSWKSSTPKVIGQYYICDYCSSAINIKDKVQDQDGGEFTLPATRIRGGSVRVVAHNACLNKMLNELEKILEEAKEKNG